MRLLLPEGDPVQISVQGVGEARKATTDLPTCLRVLSVYRLKRRAGQRYSAQPRGARGPARCLGPGLDASLSVQSIAHTLTDFEECYHSWLRLFAMPMSGAGEQGRGKRLAIMIHICRPARPPISSLCGHS